MSLRTNYTIIEDNLILGNVDTASNGLLLKKLGVNRVLTLREFGITEDKKVVDIEYFHISINDTVNDDLLTHFPKCHQFIEEGQKNGLTVLVHCRLGVSRSATIVTSYLMIKYGIHWDQALQRVRKLRKEVKPNPSFLYQLKLFDEMEFTFNALNPSFRLYLLKRWIFVTKKRIVFNTSDTDPTILDKYFPILALSPQAEGSTFNCSKCTTVLFREINVVKDLSQDKPRYQCHYVMTEPQQWMLSNVCTKSIGSIQCPNCKTTVGDYNWQRSLCSCVIHAKCKPYQVFRFVSSSLILTIINN